MTEDDDITVLTRIAMAAGPVPLSTEATEIHLAGIRAICDPLGALYLPGSRTLVVSDLHLEKGAAYARRGQMLPPYDTLATLRLLEQVIARHDPRLVVSLGDSFHDRRGASEMAAPWWLPFPAGGNGSGSRAITIPKGRAICRGKMRTCWRSTG